MDNPTPEFGPPAGGDTDGATRRRSYLAWPRGRRRVMAGAAAIVLSGLVALPVIALTSSSSGKLRSGLVFTSVPSTTAPSAPDTTTTAVPATTVPPAPTTTVAPARQPVTTTTLVCRNSYNPACGPFRWDPAPKPGGAPTISIVPSPPNPVAGQPVTFTVTISDPNTAVYTCGQFAFGDGKNQACSSQTASGACATRYGPWDPPAKYSDSVSTSYPPETYQAGTYEVSATNFLVGSSCYDPYHTLASGSISLTVKPAEVPPPSTTTTTTP